MKMTKSDKTLMKYCSRGDKYSNDRAKEVSKKLINTVLHGSVKSQWLDIAKIINNGVNAESILLNIYDVLNNNHDDSTDGLKGQQWFIRMMIGVYMEILNKDKHNQSLATFYKRGESK